MPPTLVATRSLRVLIVEDKPLDADLVVSELEHSGFAVSVLARVETAEDFVRELGQDPDVILCDYTMPHFSAPEALQLLHDRGREIPFIIVTGSIGEETAVAAIKSGADDYLLKDRLARLGAAVSQAIEEKQLRAAHDRVEEHLRQSEFKYRCLFEHLPDAACLCDSATAKIIDVNQRGEHLLGLDRAAILGTRLGRFVPDAVSRFLLASPINSNSPIPEIGATVAVADGHLIPVRVSVTPVAIHKRQLRLVFFRATEP